VDGLLLVDSNPLVWWKKYAETFPYLDQVARRYLVMPATSAPVERLFSVSGQVVTATRNRSSIVMYKNGVGQGVPYAGEVT